MRIVGLPVGPFQANSYLAICERSGSCAVVDPGGEVPRVLDSVEENKVRVESIVLTHAHLDHIGGVGELKEATGVPVYLHAADLPLYRAAPEQARSFGLVMSDQPEPDHAIEEGTPLVVGSEALEVRHTPGHSPGHVCLIGDGFAFVGDCVFAGSIGRTDLPGGDSRTLLDSINRKIMTLPEDTVLYTGHGPSTSVGHERESNPFLTGAIKWRQ